MATTTHNVVTKPNDVRPRPAVSECCDMMSSTLFVVIGPQLAYTRPYPGELAAEN
jgi:hypothetical protein